MTCRGWLLVLAVLAPHGPTHVLAQRTTVTKSPDLPAPVASVQLNPVGIAITYTPLPGAAVRYRIVRDIWDVTKASVDGTVPTVEIATGLEPASGSATTFMDRTARVGTTFVDRTAKVGITYAYMVWAISPDGRQSGSPYLTIARPAAPPSGLGVGNLYRPIGGGAMSFTLTTHILSWSLPYPHPNRIEVHQQETPTGPWSLIAQLGGAATSLVFTGSFMPGVSSFRVSSVFEAGNTQSRVSAEIRYANPISGNHPQVLSAIQSGPNEISLAVEGIVLSQNPNIGYRAFGPALPPTGVRLTAGVHPDGSYLEMVGGIPRRLAGVFRLKGVPPGTHTYQVAAEYSYPYNPFGMPGVTATVVAPFSFEISVVGVLASRETADDDPLERDGKRDEIAILAEATQLSGPYNPFVAGGRLLSISLPPGLPGSNTDLRQASAPSYPITTSTRSVVHGDIGGFPTRARAGTAGPTGGIRTGDYVAGQGASSTSVGANLAPAPVPFTVWIGDLASGTIAIRLALLEVDNDDPSTWPAAEWYQTGPGTMALPAANPSGPIVVTSPIFVGSGAATGARFIGQRYDPTQRRIGYRDRYLVFTGPALAVIANTQLSGAPSPGIVPFRVADETTGGDYTLYLRVRAVR